MVEHDKSGKSNFTGRLFRHTERRVKVRQPDCLRFARVGLPEPNRPLNERDNKIYLREIERIKLSLAAYGETAAEGDRVICIMHYPPFNGRREESEFVRQLILHDVDTVVYGHLHGKEVRSDLFVRKFNMNFWLTSADLVDFKLTEII